MLRFRTDKGVTEWSSERHPKAFGLKFQGELETHPGVRGATGAIGMRIVAFASGPGPLAIGPFNHSD